MDELLGKVIFDRYEIKNKIGAGGRGEVYQAFDRQLHDEVAVKRLLAKIAEDSHAMKRFEKEPRITRRLQSPYVVFVHSFNRDVHLGEYFSVMEYVPGGTLSKLLDTPERMPVVEALKLALEICEALDWIHERSVIHRDLKPANILITGQTKFPIKLADFGIAYQCDQSEERVVEGTPWYASPEQLSFNEDSEPLDSRSDLYSLGIILYQMLTGDPPFLGETIDVIWDQILKPPNPPKDFRPDLLPSLNELILKALAKDRDERFQSAREMSYALKAVLAEEQKRKDRLDDLYPRAMEAFVEEAWEAAVKRFSEIVQLNPYYRDTSEKLETAQHKARVITLYQEATGLMKQQAWEKADKNLTEIQQITPDYLDVAQKLEEVKKQTNLAQLYIRGTNFQTAGNWKEAQDIYVRLLTIDASYKDVSERLVETQRQQRLASLFQEALKFISQEEWTLAVKNLQQIVTEEPEYDDAVAKLKETQEQATLAEFYSQGAAYEQSRDWTRAVAAYQQVTRRNLNYKDAAVRLAHVQNRLGIRTDYEEGEAALTAEDWVEAVRRFEAVLNLDSTYRDTTTKLETARWQLNLATEYHEGLHYYKKGQWKPAIKHLMQVDKQEKGYKDTSELIAKIQERMQLEALAGQAREFYDAKQWSDAIEVWNRVLETDPNYPDAVSAQLDAKYAWAGELSGKKEWLPVINLVDEILKANPDYPNALSFKLNALFQRAKMAEEAERWPEALSILDQLLTLAPRYPQAAALRQKVRTSQNWDKVSRMIRKKLVHYPYTLWVFLLICIGVVAFFWIRVDTPFRQIAAAEVLIDGVKIDPSQSQTIANGEQLEIKVQAIDATGAPISNNELDCEWYFIPTPEPTDFQTIDGCTINYQMPADMERQSVVEEIKGKEGTSITGVLRTSIKFVVK